MEIPSLTSHCTEILRIILKSSKPPDQLLSEYVRSKKYIGSFDRRFISELIFFYLRIKSLPEFILQNHLKPSIYNQLIIDEKIKFELLILLTLIYSNELYFHSEFLINKLNESDLLKIFDNLTLNSAVLDNIDYVDFNKDVASFFKKLNSDINSNFQEINSELIDLISIRYGQQSWIGKKLSIGNKFDINNYNEFFDSFTKPSPLTIRAENPLEKNDIIEELGNNGVPSRPCSISPSGLILEKRLDLNTVQMYKAGRFEVQDEGSQLITFALDPGYNQTILDACAGAGGKSLHIASLQHDTGKIISCDVELNKLKELNNRSKRCGYRSIETVLSKNLEKLGRMFDKVLIDSPCSGMGTIRRNPMPKWKLTEEQLQKITSKQTKIVEYYSNFVKPGGELVYSTCSIMPDENEEIINKFLDNNKTFKPMRIDVAFEKYGIKIIGLQAEDYQIQLLPSIHGCDGFYIAKLRRED